MAGRLGYRIHVIEGKRMKWTKWNIHKTDEDRVRELTAALPVSHLCARLLVSRGIDEPQAVSRFLQHDLGACLLYTS